MDTHAKFLSPHGCTGAFVIRVPDAGEKPCSTGAQFYVLVQPDTKVVQGPAAKSPDPIPTSSSSRHVQIADDVKWNSSLTTLPSFGKACFVVRGEQKVPAIFVCAISLRSLMKPDPANNEIGHLQSAETSRLADVIQSGT